MDNLFTPVLGWIAQSLNFAIDTVGKFITGKFAAFFVAVFTMVLVTRYLIMPFIGGSMGFGSDKATHSAGVKKIFGGSKGKHS